jgi:AcrR family transcriptional regulator
MKRNAQINESKLSIANALLQLMETQALESIKITDLVKEAKLTRMTFYRHFNTIDDVLNFYLSQILDEIKAELSKLENPTLSDLLYLRFVVLQSHAKSMSFNTTGNIDYLIERFRIKQNSIITIIFKTDLNPFDLRYHLGGIDAVTKTWIKEGMIQSPFELTHDILRLITPTILASGLNQ